VQKQRNCRIGATRKGLLSWQNKVAKYIFGFSRFGCSPVREGPGSSGRGDDDVFSHSGISASLRDKVVEIRVSRIVRCGMSLWKRNRWIAKRREKLFIYVVWWSCGSWDLLMLTTVTHQRSYWYSSVAERDEECEGLENRFESLLTWWRGCME
jgi:hypothetical protein